MSAIDHLPFLQRLSLFRGLSEDEYRRLAARMKVREYYRGEAIFWQGALSDTLCLLEAGIAAVNRSLPGGIEQQTIAYIMPGSPWSP